MLVARGEAEVYDFADNEVPGATERDRSYWRDVGTLDAYYDAHMDLTSVEPDLQPLQPASGPSTPGPTRCRRPSSSSTTRTGAATRSTR